MNGESRFDIGEVKRNIDKAEVIALYFPALRKTLLIDTRYDPIEGPIIKLVLMVDSIEARFKSLERLRPQLPAPETVTIVPWPKYVASLQTLGIWDKIIKRLNVSGHPNGVEVCSQIFKELLELERKEIINAITGKRYQTIWERKR